MGVNVLADPYRQTVALKGKTIAYILMQEALLQRWVTCDRAAVHHQLSTHSWQRFSTQTPKCPEDHRMRQCANEAANLLECLLLVIVYVCVLVRVTASFSFLHVAFLLKRNNVNIVLPASCPASCVLQTDAPPHLLPGISSRKSPAVKYLCAQQLLKKKSGPN